MTPEKHDGDCCIFSSIDNTLPSDGVCTCGYGHRMNRENGNLDEMYSEERITSSIGLQDGGFDMTKPTALGLIEQAKDD